MKLARVVPGEQTERRPLAIVVGYRLRFAKSAEDLEAMLGSRFLVFDLELGEGLQSA